MGAVRMHFAEDKHMVWTIVQEVHLCFKICTEGQMTSLPLGTYFSLWKIYHPISRELELWGMPSMPAQLMLWSLMLAFLKSLLPLLPAGVKDVARKIRRFR